MRCTFALILCALLGAADAVFASHEEHADHAGADQTPAPAVTPEPGPYQAVVTIHGLVCSFCAVGARKALGKVEGLDRSQFTDGVFVDIDNQRVTLAFVPGAAVNVLEIREAILNAGYEPVSLHIELDGWEPPR